MIVDIQEPVKTVAFREIEGGKCFQYDKIVGIKLKYETEYNQTIVNATDLNDGGPCVFREMDQVVPLDLKVVRNS